MKYVDVDIGKACFWINVAAVLVIAILFWISTYE